MKLIEVSPFLCLCNLAFSFLYFLLSPLLFLIQIPFTLTLLCTLCFLTTFVLTLKVLSSPHNFCFAFKWIMVATTCNHIIEKENYDIPRSLITGEESGFRISWRTSSISKSHMKMFLLWCFPRHCHRKHSEIHTPLHPLNMATLLGTDTTFVPLNFTDQGLHLSISYT